MSWTYAPLPQKKLILSPMNIACVCMYFVYTHVYIVQGYQWCSQLGHSHNGYVGKKNGVALKFMCVAFQHFVVTPGVWQSVQQPSPEFFLDFKMHIGLGMQAGAMHIEVILIEYYCCHSSLVTCATFNFPLLL